MKQVNWRSSIYLICLYRECSMMEYKDRGHEEFLQNIRNKSISIENKVANQNYRTKCASISIGSQLLKASIRTEQKKVLLWKHCTSKGDQHVSTPQKVNLKD